MAKFLSFFALCVCFSSTGICSDDDDFMRHGRHNRSQSTAQQELLDFDEEELIDEKQIHEKDLTIETSGKDLKICIPEGKMNQIKMDVQKWARQQGETISLSELTREISKRVEIRIGIQPSHNQKETIAQAIIAQLTENGQLYKNKTGSPFFYTRIPLQKLPSFPNSGKKLAESPKKKEAALRPQINRTTSKNLVDYVDEALQKIQTSNSSSNGSNESNSNDDHSEESDA